MKILDFALKTVCLGMFVVTSGCAAEIDADVPASPAAADIQETSPQREAEDRPHRRTDMPAETTSAIPEGTAPSDAIVHAVPQNLIPDPDPCPSGVEVRR